MPGQIGNKGGGRLGYTFEKDQLVRLRRAVDLMLTRMDIIESGRLSPEGEAKQIERFRLFLPVVMKAMDKLHANKTQLEMPFGDENGERTSLMELTLYFRAFAKPGPLNINGTIIEPQARIGEVAGSDSIRPRSETIQE